MVPVMSGEDALKQRLQELGRKGGRQRTPAKLQQLAMARATKDFYRRNPEQRPGVKEQGDTNERN